MTFSLIHEILNIGAANYYPGYGIRSDICSRYAMKIEYSGYLDSNPDSKI